MLELTEEQRDFLILIGSPDDGTQQHVVRDGERLTQELLNLGLVSYEGKDSEGRDSYDLSDEGEQLYDALTCK